MNPFEEIELLLTKIGESIETIQTTDAEYFDAKDMTLLGTKCEELSKLAHQVASTLYDNDRSL